MSNIMSKGANQLINKKILANAIYQKVDIIDFYNLPPKPKWVPKEGEQFWKISLDCRSAISVDSTEMIRYYQKAVEQGNYFKTESEAQEALNKILEILKK